MKQLFEINLAIIENGNQQLMDPNMSYADMSRITTAIENAKAELLACAELLEPERKAA